MTIRDSATAHVGENISAASHVIRETHKALAQMFLTLDELFAKHRYEPARSSKGNWVSLAMQGAQLDNPTNWLATSLHRAYLAPEQAAQTTFVAVDVDIEPEAYTQPFLSVLAVQLARPATARDLFVEWRWAHATGWQRGQLGDAPVERELVHKIWPALEVTRATALVMDLCQLERTNLASMVVTPALALAERVRSPAP